jgi:hypothetical protein
MCTVLLPPGVNPIAVNNNNNNNNAKATKKVENSASDSGCKVDRYINRLLQTAAIRGYHEITS